jgi:hypothetical protein
LDPLSRKVQAIEGQNAGQCIFCQWMLESRLIRGNEGTIHRQAKNYILIYIIFLILKQTCKCGHETSNVGSSSSGSNSELSLGGSTRKMFLDTILMISGYNGSHTAFLVAVM